MNLKLIIPTSWSEKKIMIMPAPILKNSELTRKKFPSIDVIEPKDIKTNEKPRVKKIVLIVIRLFFPSTSLS